MNLAKLQGTRSTHRNQLCFYISAMNNFLKINKINPFIIVSKIIKCLGIYLIKEVKDLNAENYKTLLKEMKEI